MTDAPSAAGSPAGVPVRRPHLIPSLLAVWMCLAAVGHQPGWYYIVLRLIVPVVACYLAVVAFQNARAWLIPAFILVALLYNPVYKVRWDKSTWTPVNLVACVLFLGGAALRFGRQDLDADGPGGGPAAPRGGADPSGPFGAV